MSYNYLSGYLDWEGLTYEQYLASDHWQDVRRRFWASGLHNHACYVCGHRGKLEVHHASYKRIGREKLNDLRLLCRNCHQKVHDIANKPHKTVKYGTRLWTAARKLRRKHHK